jgi:hypothetical protein
MLTPVTTNLRYARISNALQRWVTHTGSAGGRSPLAGARGILASFPFSSPATAGGTGIIPE